MPSSKTEELMAMEKSFQEQSKIWEAKLSNARRLVAQMEASLLHFADLVCYSPVPSHTTFSIEES